MADAKGTPGFDVNALIRKAAQPDTTDYDRRMRAQNDLLSPPGPRRDQPPGSAYKRGGRVRHAVRNYCKGGKVISSKVY